MLNRTARVASASPSIVTSESAHFAAHAARLRSRDAVNPASRGGGARPAAARPTVRRRDVAGRVDRDELFHAERLPGGDLRPRHLLDVLVPLLRPPTPPAPTPSCWPRSRW